MKRHIQAQNMQRQVGSQPVRGRPAYLRGSVVRHQAQPLLQDGEGQEEPRRTIQAAWRAAGLGGIQKISQYLRVDQLERNPGQ